MEAVDLEVAGVTQQEEDRVVAGAAVAVVQGESHEGEGEVDRGGKEGQGDI